MSESKWTLSRLAGHLMYDGDYVMSVGLLGRKVGTTQVYDAEGRLLSVTVIEAGPCVVLQCKTQERDGYEAVQLGFGDKPRRLASRAERGHVTDLSSGQSETPKAGCEPKRYIREFRTDCDKVEVSSQQISQ